MDSDIKLHFVLINKNMSNGMRKFGNRFLTYEEILIVKKEINKIKADESVFIFNDKNHLVHTCYDAKDDKIYVGCDIFPDTEYGSTHPRDLMSIGAVLAHEYYGHRLYRNEYLKDMETGIQTTLEWEDECRASRTAAQKTPNLTQLDKANLCQDAIFRAKEYGQMMKMDEFMNEVIYGYGNTEKYFTRPIIIEYVRDESDSRSGKNRKNDSTLSKMRKNSKSKNNRNISRKEILTL